MEKYTITIKDNELIVQDSKTDKVVFIFDLVESSLVMNKTLLTKITEWDFEALR